MDIIVKEKPAVLCIQETMLSKQTNFNIKNYNELFKEGHINRRPHGGVEIFVHSNIPFKEITIKDVGYTDTFYGGKFKYISVYL